MNIGNPLLAGFLVAALSGIATPVFGDSSEHEQKAAELAELRGRISALRAELQKGHGRYEELAGELKQADRRIASVGKSLRELETRLADKGRKLDELRGKADQLEDSAKVQRSRLADQIRSAYAAGRQELVKILLNQEDPSLVGRVMTYYDYLNRARTERIGQIVETIRTLEETRSAIEAEKRELERLQQRRAEERNALAAGRKERERVLEQLRAELRTKDERLARMVENAKELEAIIQVLTESLEDIPAAPRDYRPFATMRGHLGWPIKGRLDLRFGTPRSAGLRSKGVLITSPEGQDVRAVSHGRIAFADWLRGYGMLLIVDHGDGFMSLYGHNQSLFKEAGDWIEAGDVVASVGSSGGQDTSGLYFEIRKDGRPVDPADWLRRSR